MSRFTLQCVRCEAQAPVADDTYVCAECGGNLEVRYDYEAIKASWSREDLATNPDLTMWRYAPLYPVDSRFVTPPIGWTPLFPAPRLGEDMGLADLWIKDDSRLPSASFKDRASSVALLRAKEIGAPLVTGASTGNAASSTATLAASLGMPTRIFIPHTAPRAKVAQLLAFGAEVLAVQGTYDDAFDLCLEATRRYGWYNRNTGYNPYTREGKKSVSMEICEQLTWEVPDLVAVPVGDGNIIAGVWKGFMDLHRIGFIDRLPKLLAVQASGSDAVVRALETGELEPVGGETVADSISVSLPRDGFAAAKAVRESQGFGIRVDDDEILAAIPVLARQAGVFGEPAGVTAVAGLRKAVAQGIIDPSWRTVCLVTGNGLKDIASVMKAPVGEARTVAADPAALDALYG